MINKDQQNLAWACLPKEMRDKIISAYACNRTSGKQYNIGYSDALRQLYGEHNLTSDTEPEEMLMVSKKRVMTELCRAVNLQNDREEDWIRAGEEIEFTLTQLFGDKCLLNKEEPKPKFKVGDKVFAKNSNQILTIKGIRYDSQKYDCGGFGFVPWDSLILEPYTEESRNLSQNIANYDKPTNKQLKDNMEEKELNLCELLQGCEGEKIFLPDEGECEIVSVAENELELSQEPNRTIILNEDSFIFTPTGFAYAYPSEKSFLANPLNACKAWQEWKEARKPKLWRADGTKIQTYWYIDTGGYIYPERECFNETNNRHYKYGNYFRMPELAAQAAEAVKEMFEKFNEKAER